MEKFIRRKLKDMIEKYLITMNQIIQKNMLCAL